MVIHTHSRACEPHTRAHKQTSKCAQFERSTHSMNSRTASRPSKQVQCSKRTSYAHALRENTVTVVLTIANQARARAPARACSIHTKLPRTCKYPSIKRDCDAAMHQHTHTHVRTHSHAYATPKTPIRAAQLTHIHLYVV